MKNSKPAPTTIGAQEGKTLSMAGGTYRILISGEETNGEYATIDMLIPPGSGPGPHAHVNIHESFYVVDGEVEVKSEAGSYTAKKGSFINIPKGGIVHGFKNKTDKIAHLLCMVVPSGLEEMFMELGTPIAPGTFLPPPQLDPDTIKKMQQVAEKYGQQIFPPNYLD
jgi:quercetin dioxygenase-like cupin family protein